MIDAWAPPKRPSARGGKTAKAILDAAQARFASDGYDKATVRAIAADAGVDPAMVIRHFGSKADLFAASVQLGFVDIDLTGVPAEHMGRELIRHALLSWERGENQAQESLLRTATTHPEAAAGVQAICDRQILPAIRRALPDDPDVEIRAGLAATQGLGVVLMRYLLHIEPIASMDLDLLIETVGDSVQRHLTRPLPAGSKGAAGGRAAHAQQGSLRGSHDRADAATRRS
jgi:AcrR family transcriptional regulator